jgi:hypothetical protein
MLSTHSETKSEVLFSYCFTPCQKGCQNVVTHFGVERLSSADSSRLGSIHRPVYEKVAENLAQTHFFKK